MDNGRAASGGYAAVAPIEQLLRPPVGRESYLNLCTLGEGGRRGGWTLVGGTHSTPSLHLSLLFFSSPSLLSPLPIPFHSPPRSRSPLLLCPSSGDPQGTEGPALSEWPF